MVYSSKTLGISVQASLIASDATEYTLIEGRRVKFTCRCGEPGVLKVSSLAIGIDARCRTCLNTAKTANRQATSMQRHGVGHHMQIPGAHARSLERRRATVADRYALASGSDDLTRPPLVSSHETLVSPDSLISQPCVYGWHDVATDMWYVGQTLDFKQRTRAHLSEKDGSSFHTALKMRRHDFELYRLFSPLSGGLSHADVMMTTVDQLQCRLLEEEVSHIADKRAFTHGYNLTMGGTRSRIDVSNHKRMKSALLAFDVHLRAAEWYSGRVGPLGAVDRLYVVDNAGLDLDGVRLGHIVHKWRHNRGASYLLMAGNLDKLLALGFTWRSEDVPDYVPRVARLLQARHAASQSVWASKWWPCLLWYFQQHGHVNVPQVFLCPPSLDDAKLGAMINNIRTGCHPDFVDILSRRMLFCRDFNEWGDHLLLQGMRHFRRHFAVHERRVPQQFAFPMSYHVLYLRGYGLGANLCNLMKRRLSDDTVEHARFSRIRRPLLAEMLLLHCHAVAHTAQDVAAVMAFVQERCVRGPTEDHDYRVGSMDLLRAYCAGRVPSRHDMYQLNTAMRELGFINKVRCVSSVHMSSFAGIRLK